VYVAGTSSGANIALQLAVARPDLVRKAACHDPTFFGLLESSPDTKHIAERARVALDEVYRRIEAGDHVGGAQYFIDTVSGPGSWAMVPPPKQEMYIRNAPAYASRHVDQDSWEIDIDSLRELRTPVLLTLGDYSPPSIAPVIDILAEHLADVRREKIDQAGHVPYLTHPTEYAALLLSFFEEHSE
jgi:pimeloyl-ACP methyl ester carboxylesterase